MELKTNELDIPDGPTAMVELDGCITYDKFTVIVKCAADLPLYSSTKGLDIKSKWAAIGAAEVTRVKGNTKPHFLFECDVDDLRDVVGALRDARKKTTDGMVTLVAESSIQMKVSELEQCFSSDASAEQHTKLFKSLCCMGKDSQPSSDEAYLMDHTALSKVVKVLGISLSGNDRGSVSGESDLLQETLTKYDTSGKGQALDEEGFRNLLGFHARQLVGSSLESLVNHAQRAVFESFLEGVPLHHSERDIRPRSETAGESDGFLHSSASSSSLLGPNNGYQTSGGVVLKLETENDRLRQTLVSVLSVMEAGLNSQGCDASNKIKELVANKHMPATGCSDLVDALKAGMK